LMPKLLDITTQNIPKSLLWLLKELYRLLRLLFDHVPRGIYTLAISSKYWLSQKMEFASNGGS
jgi:hypothetical protein